MSVALSLPTLGATELNVICRKSSSTVPMSHLEPAPSCSITSCVVPPFGEYFISILFTISTPSSGVLAQSFLNQAFVASVAAAMSHSSSIFSPAPILLIILPKSFLLVILDNQVYFMIDLDLPANAHNQGITALTAPHTPNWATDGASPVAATEPAAVSARPAAQCIPTLANLLESIIFLSFGIAQNIL